MAQLDHPAPRSAGSNRRPSRQTRLAVWRVVCHDSDRQRTYTDDGAISGLRSSRGDRWRARTLRRASTWRRDGREDRTSICSGDHATPRSPASCNPQACACTGDYPISRHRSGCEARPWAWIVERATRLREDTTIGPGSSSRKAFGVDLLVACGTHHASRCTRTRAHAGHLLGHRRQRAEWRRVCIQHSNVAWLHAGRCSTQCSFEYRSQYMEALL